MRKTLAIIAFISAAGLHAENRVTVREDGSIVVPQVKVSVKDMMSGKTPVSKTERDEFKEKERHNRAVEKALRRYRSKDDPFAMPQGGKANRAGPVKRLPPNAKSY